MELDGFVRALAAVGGDIGKLPTSGRGAVVVPGMQTGVPFPSDRRRTAVTFGGDTGWAVVVHRLRLCDHRGRAVRGALDRLVSPYPQHRSALGVATALVRSGLPGRRALVIVGEQHPDWPIDAALALFESTARLALHVEAVPVVHQRGSAVAVAGWRVAELV